METQKWHFKGAKELFEESRVERMIPFSIRSQFDSVLAAQQLADVASTFGAPDYFDEVPLYSRYQQVEFLRDHGDVNLLLMELALDYLDRVVADVHIDGGEQFLAITVISDDDKEYIVPAIFVCNGEVQTRLKSLHLSPPSEGLGKRTEILVKTAKPDIPFSVLEDRQTVPDDPRIFVSYKSPPRGVTNLTAFARGT